ncbi:solute carrier family 22 member 7 [Papilio machaon]|uniref:solute carrier family 22 member 7 n=1 Tax=Papilio machaon TaxID=76193 RepID=UPI001E664811|nr:solute carrier family 22 member 7 [Papilio machaon]
MDSVFDQALIEIGQDGRFQKKFDIIYNVIFAVLWPMAYMNLILALVVVPHMCEVSGKPDSVSEHYWKELNIPQYTNAAGEIKFESCLMYINGSTSNNTKACDKYEYDKTWYEETVPTKNNWVCDKELYVANIFAASKIGELVGSMVFGWFGDTYGRRPAYIIALVLLVLGRVISLFAGQSFVLFVIGCVVAAFPSWSAIQSVTVISMELSSAERRSTTATLRFAGWSVGMALMALLFWWLRHWRTFFIATTILQVPFVIFSWKMIESPRWLWIQGQSKKCVKYLKQIAKENKKDLSLETENSILTVKPVQNNETLGYIALFSGWTLAKTTTLQLVFWVCISVNYTVIMMSSGDKSDGNPFLEFLWQALAEVPGYFLAAWLADRIGRRNTGVLSFSISACMWIIHVLRENSSNAIFRHSLTSTAIVIVTRLSATMGYYIINILNFELYPTCIRQSGMSLGNLFSSGGSALAPYIFYLGHRVNLQLSSVILTGVSVIGVISTLLLPETLNKKLPETIEDAQVFGKNTQTYTPVLLNTSGDDPVAPVEKN